MSLDSWKAEFYPVPAHKVPENQALHHSLRKWIGLRPENLQRHGLKIAFLSIYEIEREFIRLYINSRSCALCFHYYNHHKVGSDEACIGCPLYAVRNCPCDEDSQGLISPYGSWLAHKDPEPMIRLLQAALE